VAASPATDLPAVVAEAAPASTPAPRGVPGFWFVPALMALLMVVAARRR